MTIVRVFAIQEAISGQYYQVCIQEEISDSLEGEPRQDWVNPEELDVHDFSGSENVEELAGTLISTP